MTIPREPPDAPPQGGSPSAPRRTGTVLGRLAPTAASLLVVCAVLEACSSAPGGGGGPPPGVYCAASVGGAKVCYGYSNLTPDEQSAISQECTQSLGGSIATSCPDGPVGCCATTTGGYTTTECYYAGQASTYEPACKAAGGTWSASGSSDAGASSGGGDATSSGPGSGSGGSGGGSSSGGGSGSGGSSGSGSSGSGSGSGSSGGPCTAPSVQCPKGCANLDTDVDNCGSCGYRCPGGPPGTVVSCAAGQCVTSGDAGECGACATDSDCQTAACPPPPGGGSNCCDQGSGVCYASLTPSCPVP